MALAAMLNGRVRSRVYSRDTVAHALEIHGHRGQFGGVVVPQGFGKPCCKAGTGSFDDVLELAQPGSGRTVPELRCSLQTDHFSRELPVRSGSFGR
jgi:hypothetical protein